jgi:hypothetical protein
MVTDEKDWDELERLWRAVRRDVFFEIEAAAGFHPLGESQLKRSRRLNRNWRRFAELDIDLASRLAHGLREVALLFSQVEVRGTTPMERHLLGLDTAISLADAENGKSFGR